MIAVYPNCSSALGLTGLLRSPPELRLVPGVPTNQLQQVMEPDCLCGASLSSLMLSVGTSISFPSQPSPDRPRV